MSRLFNKYIYSQAIAKLLPMEKKIFKKYADCRNAAIAAKDTFVEAVNDQPWSETWKTAAAGRLGSDRDAATSNRPSRTATGTAALAR